VRLRLSGSLGACADARRRGLAAACAALLAAGAWAARPLATDDTSTAAAGECQLEAWIDKSDPVRAQVLAPACGITEELEFDMVLSRLVGSGQALSGMATGLKCVPEAAAFDTTLGQVRLGAIAFASWARDPALGWRGEGAGLAGLSSLTPDPDWNLYANAYVLRRWTDGHVVGGARAAVAWQPGEHWLLFVEGLWASDSTRIANAGLRFWAVPKVLGLDLIATRSASGSQAVSVGLGWYGLRMF
jgi:hypothetical protein